MKTAISVPDETFDRVDAAAGRLGMSRSQFYARAAERWLRDLDDEGITARINASIDADGHDEEGEAFVRRAAHDLVRRGHWE